MYDLSSSTTVVSIDFDIFENPKIDSECGSRSPHEELKAKHSVTSAPGTVKPATWTEKLAVLALRDIAEDVAASVFGFSHAKELGRPCNLDVFKIEQSTLDHVAKVRLANTSTIIRPVLDRRREGDHVRPGLPLRLSVPADLAKAA